MIIKLLAVILVVYIIFSVLLNVYVRTKYTKEELKHFYNLIRQQKAERKRFDKMMKTSNLEIFSPQRILRDGESGIKISKTFHK